MMRQAGWRGGEHVGSLTMMTIVTKTTTSNKERIHRTHGLLLVTFVMGLIAMTPTATGGILSNIV